MRSIEAYVGWSDQTWSTWPVDVPDGLPEDDIEEYVRSAITGSGADEFRDAVFCGVYYVGWEQ